MSNPAGEKKAARQKILIVDDREENLFVLEKLLKDAPADILRALDGQTALAQVLDHDFSLIILDVRMPGMNGYEVAEHLKGDDQTKHIPIIFVTAEYPDEEHIVRGYKSGAVDYMLKPYSPRILLSKVNLLLETDRNRKELQQYREQLEQLVSERTAELSIVSSELLQFSWLLEKETTLSSPEHDDMTGLNQDGLILKTIGQKTLKDMSDDVMDLLDTSLAVYEKNGDCAFGSFISSWCGTLDKASRELCQMEDNREAVDCGKWLCHDSCQNISKTAIETQEPVDHECAGGMRIYAVPIRAGEEIIGAIKACYGTPPSSASRLAELAETYGIDPEILRRSAEAYKPRPPFIIEVAKRRLHSIARLIGEIVERKQVEYELQSHNEELELFNKMAVGRELRMIELKKEVNALCRQAGKPEHYPLNTTSEDSV